MAARDTTASLIASVIYQLAKNQEIQCRARAEVFALLGSDGLLSAADVKALPYMRAILNETLG